MSAGVLLAGGCGERGSPDNERTADDPIASRGSYSAPLEAQSTSPGTYRHPLQADVPNLSGTPLLDAKDDPNSGNRLVVGDAVFARADGTIEQFSGIATMSSDPGTEAPSPFAKQGTPQPKRVDTAPVIGPELSARMASVGVGERLAVDIVVRQSPDYEPIMHLMERAIADGRVLTRQDWRDERQRLIRAQQMQVASVLQPVVSDIGALGGSVTSTCRNIPCLSALLTAGQITQVASLPAVRRIDPIFAPKTNTISGAAVSWGTQMRLDTTQNEQFQDDDYLGNENIDGRIEAGVIEWQKIDVDHPGFKEDSSSGTTRIIDTLNCDAGSCSSASWGTPNESHATSVAGLLVGDLTDGQDSSETDPTEQFRKSGYGREAELWAWRPEDPNDLDTALDDVAGKGVSLVNISISTTGDSTCTGTTTSSKELNDLFEAGVLPIFAAGNDGHDSTSDCRVDHPGAAVGAFVVGAHTNSFSSENQTQVRYGAIWEESATRGSSRGGTWDEGDSRGIIDVTAAGCRDLMFGRLGGYGVDGCGTSWAAPTVGGGAIEYIDWYRDNVSDAIDHPAKLAAALLLMGDRQTEGGGKATTNCNNLWGCGRLKMRRYDSQGMDGPWGWGSLNTCIDNGETYYWNLNGGNEISTDVDALKFVTWWYDSRHENGTSIDDIDISLQYESGGTWYTARSAASFNIEKESLFYGAFNTARKWRLKFHGYDVTAGGHAGCPGTNSMRIYFTYMYEDSDREAHEVLDDIDPEDS